MTSTVHMPLWLLLLLLAFAAVTFASHFLFPSVRWFFRRRLERAVARLNTRLTRPIEPFKLARRHDMIQRLVYDPDVTQAIVDYAAKHKVREDVAFEKARSYAREIVPSFSAFAYFSFGTRVAKWLANLLYDVRTGPHNAEIIEGIDKDATLIFIMNHRSNMDYVLVTMLAAQSSALSYAVGEWARVWPLSRLIKAMGAYFIRRRSRGGLYRAVLARYVQMATTGGVTQAIFPEGGLTVDGIVKPAKLGLLSYVVEGWKPGGRDVVFVPVAINYDRVLEDRVLIAAGARGDRRFHARASVIMRSAVRIVWRRLRGRFAGFGDAAVAFAQPVRLSDYGDAPSLGDLGRDLMGRIEDAMPLLYVPMVARLILRSGTPLDEAALGRAAADMAQSERGSVVADPAAGIARACAALAKRGAILQAAGGWQIAPDGAALLTFYANSIAHLLPGGAPEDAGTQNAAGAQEISAPAGS
ncbi:glycerol-3-phosphate acyltransferase [Pelagivirga sediminicola]|uniref:Glycerol-3-phosphate acyltransferase n=1 Tax=Pelagivirga sediminicola TaxID=2170575 RepID=A0A2T7G6T4_9RHOB|nr:1-acyl-sn-glycerol-3-phosphate acyltransferase [Pelagivirga sediminicola]PVA10086.1 glycerol-3-phosphate acyltransferase [Pelagivirga sediminicola]